MARLLPKGVGGTNLAFLLLIALLAAACGANSTTSSNDTSNASDAVDSSPPEAVAFEEPDVPPTSEPALTPIRVAARSSLSVSPLWIADARGFFREQGIQIEYVPVTSESGVSTAIGVQTATIGLVSADVALQANNQRIRSLAYLDATDAVSTDARGSMSLIASTEAGIVAGCGLEAKTVAVDSRGSVSAIAVREMVLRDGCNPLLVNFTTLDANEIAVQLRSGEVDAAATFDPVTSELLRSSNDLVANLDLELCPGFGRCPLWVAVARIDWVEENPKLSKRFTDAMNDAMTWIWANEVEYRAELVRCCAVNADDASEVLVPNFAGDRRDLGSDMSRLRKVLETQREALSILRSQENETDDGSAVVDSEDSEQSSDPTSAEESESLEEEVDG